MRRRYCDPTLDLCDVALAVGASSRQLQRVFREVAATDFRGELLALRMREAERLLRRGMPVRRVASRVGYAGPSGLVAAFKRATGVPPSALHPAPLDYDHEWRRKERETDG
jgi:AraC-like DNA-binding protein